MPLYECVFVARQDVGSAQLDVLLTLIEEIIKENGGNVIYKEVIGSRNLSHRIKKTKKGNYFVLRIDAPPKAIKELQRKTGINELIVRSLITRQDSLETSPSALFIEKNNREGIVKDEQRNFSDKSFSKEMTNG